MSTLRSSYLTQDYMPDILWLRYCLDLVYSQFDQNDRKTYGNSLSLSDIKFQLSKSKTSRINISSISVRSDTYRGIITWDNKKGVCSYIPPFYCVYWRIPQGVWSKITISQLETLHRWFRGAKYREGGFSGYLHRLSWRHRYEVVLATSKRYIDFTHHWILLQMHKIFSQFACS
jgi:hypothetical protein